MVRPSYAFPFGLSILLCSFSHPDNPVLPLLLVSFMSSRFFILSLGLSPLFSLRYLVCLGRGEVVIM